MSIASTMIRTKTGLIHRDLSRGDDGEGARGADGARLDHAEGTSQPLSPKQAEREPKDAIARSKGDTPIDQAAAAGHFLAAPEHEKMHDERLWDLRMKRDREAFAIPEWEEMRELASLVKQHTLSRLDEYLGQFETNAKKNGIEVHWARDGAEHNAIIGRIMRDHEADSLIKSKSMLTDECGLREYADQAGFAVIETDFGERIQQLDGEMPSHIVVPATHKLRTDVARVFADKLGSDPNNADVHYLAA